MQRLGKPQLMTTSLTLMYPGPCPDPAETLAGTSVHAGPHCCSQPLPKASESDGRALHTGNCCLPSPLLLAEGLWTLRIFTEDLPIPGDTAWPGHLQTWAHVGSDGQESYPVLVTLVGFLLSAPSYLSTTALWSSGGERKAAFTHGASTPLLLVP